MSGRNWLRDRWVPLAFAAFCLAVLAANGTMIALAIATWPGLATADAYRKGITYNRSLVAAREQAALGWRGAIDFRPTGAGRGRLELRLTDPAGQPVEGAQVRAEVVRPARAGHDFIVGLDRTVGGVYVVDADFPLPGVWDVLLRAESGQERFQASRRVMVR